MKDKPLADKLAAALQEKVRTEFSIEKMLEQTLNLYGATGL